MTKVVEMAAVRHLELKSHKCLKKNELKMNPSELVLVTGGQNQICNQRALLNFAVCLSVIFIIIIISKITASVV